MKLFISKKLSVSEKEAFILQKKFYNEYGTTLYGLMKHHQFDPDEFLDFVHDIDLSKLKKILNYLIKLTIYREQKLFTQTVKEIMQKKFYYH